MEAPRLPRSVADLDEWSVYGDHLMTIGDPLGEFIAFELSLPELPTPEQITDFQTRAALGFHSNERTPTTWCLGHARSLAIGGVYHFPSPATFSDACDFLRTPAGSRIEELWVANVDEPGAEHYRSLFAAVPSTCERVTLELAAPTVAAADTVLALLPQTVREVQLRFRTLDSAATARFLDDRFAIVEPPSHQTEDVYDLLPALTATRSVRMRIVRAHGSLHPRCVLGSPDDAAIIDLRDRPGRHVLGTPPKLVAIDAPLVQVIARNSDQDLQRRYGIIPVRTRLARGVDERMRVVVGPYDSGIREGYAELHLMRHVGEWTARANVPFSIEGIEVGSTVTPLPDGAAFTLDGWPARFLARDIDARVRAMFR